MTAVEQPAVTPSRPEQWSPAAERMVRSRLHVPDAPPHHLPRRRLSGLLDENPVPLVLLSAPAGSGKTALAVEWAHRLEGVREVLWVSCHEGDPDPWPEVLLGSAGGGDLRAGAPRRLSSWQERVEHVLEAAARSALPWTVFLDSHELRGREEARELDLLLTYAGPRLQVVLTCRADPVLPLHRYRLAGDLLEVRAADLAFTDEEARTLLEEGGLALDPADVGALNARLAGWAAGLRFAVPVLAAHPRPRELVSAAVTRNGNINAFLVEEVLDVQPPDLRSLILTTSVPDALSPGLLEELTGEPAAPTTLRLMRANVFLEDAVGDESGLHYMPFFRDLVRAQLALESPDRLRALHRRAARWYAAQGSWSRAVDHLARAGEEPDCAALLVDHLLVGRLLCERPHDPFRRLVATVPVPSSPTPAHDLLLAACALAEGRATECAARLGTTRASGPLPDGVGATLAVLEAVLSAETGHADRTEPLAARARELLAAHRRADDPGAHDTVAVLLLARARAAVRQGAVDRAERLLEAGLGTPTAGWSTSYRAQCLAHLALLHTRDGRTRRATREAEEAVLAAGSDGVATAVATAAHLARALVAVDGDPREAATHLAETCEHPDPLWTVVRAVVAAGLERAHGPDDTHPRHLVEVQDTAERAGPWAVAWVRAVAGAPASPIGSWATGVEDRVVEPLTPREQEVLVAMSEWLTTEEIAAALFVSVNTVRTHVRNILTKLGVSRRHAAIREALRLGLLPADRRPAEARPAARTG